MNKLPQGGQRMAQPKAKTVADFSASAAGAAFDDAYARLLRRWPDDTTTSETEGRFGTTHVTTAGQPRTTGAADAPALLLLHGGGATSMAWTALAGHLAGGHRVIAPDIIGEPGRSRSTGDRFRSTDDLCDWIDEVLDDSAAPTVDVVAHSYGAMIALAYALRRPHRVRRLVLLDPNSCFAGMSAAYLIRALPVLLRPDADRQRRLLVWGTQGADLDPDWLTVTTTGVGSFPSARPVIPRRPRPQDLRALDAHRVSVLLAPDSRVHDVAQVATNVRAALPTAAVVTLPAGTHHTLPMSPSDHLEAALDAALR
jgi:pimeloyl-ACP methyl ester carboxylesterase